MIFDKNILLEEGYLSFNLHDLNADLYERLQSLFDKEKLLNLINKIRYECVVFDDVNESDIKETCSKYLHENDSFVELSNNKILRIQARSKDTFSDIENLYKIIKSYSKRDIQYWYYTSLGNTDSEYNKNIVLLTHDIFKDIIEKLYPLQKNLNYGNSVDLTLYTKGGFIENHEDGYDQNRLCVILIYLNEDYKDGFGGEIKVKDSNIIKPKFGEIVILDFTKNNLKHEVLPVLDDNFKRLAFIKFFHI